MMAAAAGGGIKTSANMWAMLADDDTGDSEAAKRYERETKVKEAAEYRHQQAVAAAASEAAVGNNATRTHGHNQKKALKNKKKARNEKKARKDRPRKQRKKLRQPVAVANGDANTAVVVQAAEATTVGSDDESDGEEASTSYCRTVIGRLLRAAVAAVLIAFWVHAAAPAHTAT